MDAKTNKQGRKSDLEQTPSAKRLDLISETSAKQNRLIPT